MRFEQSLNSFVSFPFLGFLSPPLRIDEYTATIAIFSPALPFPPPGGFSVTTNNRRLSFPPSLPFPPFPNREEGVRARLIQRPFSPPLRPRVRSNHRQTRAPLSSFPPPSPFPPLPHSSEMRIQGFLSPPSMNASGRGSGLRLPPPSLFPPSISCANNRESDRFSFFETACRQKLKGQASLFSFFFFFSPPSPSSETETTHGSHLAGTGNNKGRSLLPPLPFPPPPSRASAMPTGLARLFPPSPPPPYLLSRSPADNQAGPISPLSPPFSPLFSFSHDPQSDASF